MSAMNKLTEDEAGILEAYRTGRAIICHTNVGLGVKVTELSDGRASIEVDPMPHVKPTYYALRQTMKQTIKQWQSLLAKADAR